MRISTATGSTALLSLSSVSSLPHTPTHAFESVKQKRQVSSSPLEVDLGYETYEGYTNQSTGLNAWLGIRYAAPPTGTLRWQPPRTPTVNRSSRIQATQRPNICPQGPFGSTSVQPTISPPPGASVSEDCLFLNVYSPPNAANLPVLVWIHGGGYGEGSANVDPSMFINTNDNGIVSVIIQYRLAAFGFLSSDEVYRNGAANAGILDQHFALQWVQSYIGLFGGNASQVSIAGESAGGGSVMLQAMAYGGTQGTALFSNAIAASAYLPMQYGYNDWIPSQSYYAFAAAAGCFDTMFAFGSTGSNESTIFSCLVNKDTETLQNASATISASGRFGTWGFLPVTDSKFIQQLPSQQLLKRQINGLRMLSGNNAEEGPYFVEHDIDSEEKFLDFLRYTFPLFKSDDISKLLLYYPSSNASDSPTAPFFATTGDSGPTAINQSTLASGQQQRAYNIYAESTFVCPSYWLAEAYSNPSMGMAAYKYQYSVPVALHGSDVVGYFGPATPNQGPNFVRAFMRIWGNFVRFNDPSINATVAGGSDVASDWPAYSSASPFQLNLNETGGELISINEGFGRNSSEDVGPGLQNDFSLVNAYTWEGGRGTRCDFWRAVASIVPE